MGHTLRARSSTRGRRSNEDCASVWSGAVPRGGGHGLERVGRCRRRAPPRQRHLPGRHDPRRDIRVASDHGALHASRDGQGDRPPKRRRDAHGRVQRCDARRARGVGRRHRSASRDRRDRLLAGRRLCRSRRRRRAWEHPRLPGVGRDHPRDDDRRKRHNHRWRAHAGLHEGRALRRAVLQRRGGQHGARRRRDPSASTAAGSASFAIRSAARCS